MLMNLPVELLLEIISHFTMAEFLRFRSVCRFFFRIINYHEGAIARQLIGNPEFRRTNDLFRVREPEKRTYKHLFRVERRCSVVNTLANFLTEHHLEKYTKEQLFHEMDIRAFLLLLAHYLERHRCNLEAFVTNRNNNPRLGRPNEAIEDDTLAVYNHKAAYLLCGLHDWLMPVLETRLRGHRITLIGSFGTPRQQYAQLLILGGIEALKDSIVPDVFEVRNQNMSMHMERAWSGPFANNTKHVHVPAIPRRVADLALVLDPVLPSLRYHTAIEMCRILPRAGRLLETLLVSMPENPNMPGHPWAVSLVITCNAAEHFELEISSPGMSAVSEWSFMYDGSKEWLVRQVRSGSITLIQVQ